MSSRPVEDVWTYPRPPAVDRSGEHVVVELGGEVIAETDAALRVLETSHPPTYYLPSDAFAPGVLVPARGHSVCEWKGVASYLDLETRRRTAARAAWVYPEPVPAYALLADHVALYPGLVDRCLVDDELVVSQPGDFYGGWITSRVRGPFKGAPGTAGW